jgi:ribosomal protein S27E
MNKKVVNFKEAKESLEEYSLQLKDGKERRYTTDCYHQRIELDSDTGLVTCLDCEKVMSCEQWVYTLAVSEKRVQYRLHNLLKKTNKFFWATCPDCGKRHRIYPKE